MPAAFLGALVNATLPASVVLLGLAALTLFVGVQQLQPRAVPETRDALATEALVAVGALVGFLVTVRDGSYQPGLLRRRQHEL